MKTWKVTYLKNSGSRFSYHIERETQKEVIDDFMTRDLSLNIQEFDVEEVDKEEALIKVTERIVPFWFEGGEVIDQINAKLLLVYLDMTGGTNSPIDFDTFTAHVHDRFGIPYKSIITTFGQLYSKSLKDLRVPTIFDKCDDEGNVMIGGDHIKLWSKVEDMILNLYAEKVTG